MSFKAVLQWIFAISFFYTAANLVYSAYWQNWTYDEPFHLGWSERLLNERIDKREFVNYQSTEPINVLNVLGQNLGRKVSWGEYGIKFMTRVPTMILYFLLILTVFLISKNIFGITTALLATSFTLLDTNLVAHGFLVTVDLAFALFSLLFFYFLWRFYERASWRNTALLFAALSLCFITKVSSLLLLVPFFLMMLFTLIKTIKNKQSLISLFLKLEVGVCLFVFLVAAGYLFCHIGWSPGDTPLESRFFQTFSEKFPNAWLPLPESFISAFDRIISSETTTFQNVVFLGKEYPSGVWYFFPIVAFLKTPTMWFLGFFILLVYLLRFGFKNNFFQRFFSNRKSFSIYLLAVLVFLIGYFCIFFRSQIGIRFILFLFPLFYILLARLIEVVVSTRLAILGFIFCFGLGLVEQAFYFGNTLAFTNLAVYPKATVYRWISDSNIHWGQNADKIRSTLEKKNITAYVDPVHILPGENIFDVNQIAGIWWNYPKYKWVRDNLEPFDHLMYTYMRFYVSEDDFERFMVSQRTFHSTGKFPACTGSLVKDIQGSDTWDYLPKHLKESCACIAVNRLTDLTMQPQAGVVKIKWRIETGRFDRFEEMNTRSPTWFRLSPGQHLFCLESERLKPLTIRADSGPIRIFY